MYLFFHLFKASTTEVISLLGVVVWIRKDWNCFYGWLGTRVCVARYLLAHYEPGWSPIQELVAATYSQSRSVIGFTATAPRRAT